jgi:hypothetical protein
VKGKALSAPQGRVVETDDAEALEASAVRHKAVLEAVGATAFWLHLCRRTKVEVLRDKEVTYVSHDKESKGRNNYKIE